MRCDAIEDTNITLSINDEGNESTTYIHGRTSEIERVCSEYAGRKCTVKIKQETMQIKTDTTAIDPKVASSEIVKSAAQLFDGTLLRVTELEASNTDSINGEKG